jgi:N-acetylglucosaminyldiphosphoundecaprenol N-acetyl-beta-D-mannosaminyltransferase
VVEAAAAKRSMLVVNTNAHFAVLSQRNPWMRDLFARADIAFCDGTGVQLAARFLIGRVRGGRRPPTGLGLCSGKLSSMASIFSTGS